MKKRKFPKNKKQKIVLEIKIIVEHKNEEKQQFTVPSFPTPLPYIPPQSIPVPYVINCVYPQDKF